MAVRDHMAAEQEREQRLSLAPTTEAFEATLDIWERLLGKLLDSGHDRGLELAVGTLSGASHPGPERRMAVSAARRLLVNQPSSGWSVVRPYLSNREFATSLALGLADDFTHGPIVRALDEDQLGELYRWLAELFPPEEDREIDGVHAVGAEEQARHWREAVVRNLANRGTDRAVAVLAGLTREFPQRLGIAANLVNARAAVQANAWSPPTPEELAQLFADVTRRLVRSNSELLALVIDVLLIAAAELPSHCELLWDRTPASRRTPKGSEEQGVLAETWRPKPEAALSAYLAHELQLRLTGRGVAVNREILVRPTNAYGAGDRTDLTVEAPLVHDPFDTHPIAPPARVAVVVEVKGCWNPDLRCAQRDQLAVRYLPEASTDHGAYVVGWYPIALWTARRDPRKTAARRIDQAGLESHLAAQAGEILRDLRRHTRPLVIAVPRPFRPGQVSEAPEGSVV